MQVNRDVYFAVREVSSRHLRFTNLHHAWLKLCRVERQMTSKEKKGESMEQQPEEESLLRSSNIFFTFEANWSSTCRATRHQSQIGFQRHSSPVLSCVKE